MVLFVASKTASIIFHRLQRLEIHSFREIRCISTLPIAFSIQAHGGKPLFSPIVKVSDKNSLLRPHHLFFWKFHMVCNFQIAEIWCHISVQTCNTIWFDTIFWIKQESLFTVPYFSRKSVVMVLFVATKTASIIFHRLQRLEIYSFPEIRCISTLAIAFSIQAHGGKPLFSPSVNISDKNSLLRPRHLSFWKFHMVCNSQPIKIWCHNSVLACSTI